MQIVNFDTSICDVVSLFLVKMPNKLSYRGECVVVT